MSSNQLAQCEVKKSEPTSPPHLAQMTNVVNVLDLHKDFANETKIYDKDTNTVYVYSNASKMGETLVSNESPEQQHIQQMALNLHSSDPSIENGIKSNNNEQYEMMQENGVMLQRILNDHMLEGARIPQIDERNDHQLVTKINAGDDSLLRLIESNNLVSKLVGENQQIISRDIINGEHHIITRNENGEHILTRIVNTGSMDNAKLNDDIYHSNMDQLPLKSDDHKIIYTSQDTGCGVIKNHNQSCGNNTNPDMQKQIDVIYEDGNKTVIYTSSSNAISSHPESPTSDEQKGMEMYTSGECINSPQVIVQGNLQYLPQIQPDGSTVYVVSELSNNDLNVQK
jgi:hypothetical protein